MLSAVWFVFFFSSGKMRLGFWQRGAVCNITELRSSHAKHQHLITIIFNSHTALGYIYHSHCFITQQGKTVFNNY